MTEQASLPPSLREELVEDRAPLAIVRLERLERLEALERRLSRFELDTVAFRTATRNELDAVKATQTQANETRLVDHVTIFLLGCILGVLCAAQRSGNGWSLSWGAGAA